MYRYSELSGTTNNNDTRQDPRVCHAHFATRSRVRVMVLQQQTPMYSTVEMQMQSCGVLKVFGLEVMDDLNLMLKRM